MSIPRLLCVPRVAAASRRTLSNRTPPRGLQALARWQSTKSSAPRGFRTGRFIAYTITTSGLAVGGVLAYANYDPVFKNQVDEYIPGFARLADTAADLFIDRVKPVHPSPSGVTGERGSRAGGASVGYGRENMVPVDVSKEKRKERGAPQSPDTVKDQLSNPKQEQGKADLVQTNTQGEEILEKPPTVSMETTPTLGHSNEVGGSEGAREIMEEEVEGVVEDVEGEVESKGERVEKVEGGVEGVKGGVERVVEEVRGEVQKVAGEVREEKVREQQEAQMADHQLSWLKDSAQVEEKLEQTLQEFVSQTDKVAEAQKNVLVNSQEHGQLMKGITSDVAEDLESARNTAGAMYEAGEAVRVAEEALSDATDRHKTLFQSLKELMDRAVELGLKSKVEDVEVKMRECGGRLTEGSAAVQQAEIERKLLQDYQKQAQRDREQLQRELGQELPEGDSRQEAVLVMLGRRVEVLKQKLQDMERDHQERLTAALERQKASLEEVAERTLDWRLRDKEREMQQELSYRADSIHREYQSELREQLKRQTDSHNQLLSDALNTQEEQLAEKWSGELELKLTEQESHYQREMALTLSHLRGIEYMVNTIAAAGNETKRQQGMRAACDSLHTALQAASTSRDPNEFHSLQREVIVLRDSAKDDPFILAMLDSLPARALSPGGGIQGEGGLRERFTKVKRICRRVALVPERGGGLGTYTLSYLQSLLIVSWRFVGRTAREMEDEDLNTFAILERADACIRQGDIELAVRYMNLLRGEPRSVARDWLCNARSYLETLQAVQLVSEYMAALNITASATAAPAN